MKIKRATDFKSGETLPSAANSMPSPNASATVTASTPKSSIGNGGSTSKPSSASPPSTTANTIAETAQCVKAFATNTSINSTCRYDSRPRFARVPSMV